MYGSEVVTSALVVPLPGSVAAWTQTATVRPSSAVAQVLESEPLLGGAAWYRGHWPESRWKQDLALMDAHLKRAGTAGGLATQIDLPPYRVAVSRSELTK